MKIIVFVSTILLAACSVHSVGLANEMTKPMDTGQETKEGDAVLPNTDHYRALIGDTIEHQGAGIILPSVRARLIEELKRPIAVGGKSGHYPPSAADLAAGWEVFVKDSSVKAVVEYTEGEIARGEARQIVVQVLMREGDQAAAVFSLTITRVGPPTSKSDLERLKLNDAKLKEAGLK